MMLLGRGRVLRVRESPYVDKKTNQPVIQLYLDLFDDTAGLLQCEMRKSGADVPGYDEMIVFGVQMLRPSKFGTGVSVVIKEWKPVSSDAPGWSPPAVSVPSATAKK